MIVCVVSMRVLASVVVVGVEDVNCVVGGRDGVAGAVGKGACVVAGL